MIVAEDVLKPTIAKFVELMDIETMLEEATPKEVSTLEAENSPAVSEDDPAKDMDTTEVEVPLAMD